MKELVRIANTDIPGKRPTYHALRKIKGVSYSFSHAICSTLNIPKQTQIGTLSEQQIKQVEDHIKNHNIPSFLFNRQKDRTTGNDKHLTTSDLKLQQEFDIRNLKKIKSYRGMRHAVGLPVRGQRTQGNFRKGSTVGVQKKKAQPAKSDKGKAKGKK